jgi:uncharacterized protein (TIGR02301 family)
LGEDGCELVSNDLNHAAALDLVAHRSIIIIEPDHMLRILIALSLSFCFAAGSARAQTLISPVSPPKPQPQVQPRAQPSGQPPGQAQSAPPTPPGPVPYDRDLQRLSEILGSLHFLRGICGSNEGQKWRMEAQSLIDAEAPGGERHEQMIASFNRGYRAFEQSYRTCTPAADFAIRRYLEEGAKIAREITARYAN